jgi:hypothetical protein
MASNYAQGPSAGDISAMLASRMQEVIRELGISGKLVARGARFEAVCPWRPTSVNMSIGVGQRPGAWTHWSSGEKGDALGLVAAVLAGGETRDMLPAIKWAKAFLGLAGAAGEDEAERIKREEKTRIMAQKAREDQELRARRAEKALAGDRKRAQALWLSGKPLVSGDPVWQYLLARGIDLAALPRVPSSLRYLADHEHVDDDGVATVWPCMAAAMISPHGDFWAIHRTWIDPDRAGKKAPVAPARKIWPGSFQSSAIRLHRGAGGKSMKETKPYTDIVTICEGVEDGLTLALLNPDLRVDVVGSLGCFQFYQIPACAKALRIAGDRDWNNAIATKAFDEACRWLNKQALGLDPKVSVSLIWPPEPHKDWNGAMMASKGLGA